MVLLVEAAHGCGGRWDHIVDKEEKSVLGSEADAFSDQKVKLKKNKTG